MYAIVEFAGQQVKVEETKLVEVPRMEGNVGDAVESDKVLFSHNDNDIIVGYPYIKSAKVTATIYAQDRTKKTVASIYKKRKQYKKSWGIRRDFTLLKINTISM